MIRHATIRSGNQTFIAAVHQVDEYSDGTMVGVIKRNNSWFTVTRAFGCHLWRLCF